MRKLGYISVNDLVELARDLYIGAHVTVTDDTDERDLYYRRGVRNACLYINCHKFGTEDKLYSSLKKMFD